MARAFCAAVALPPDELAMVGDAVHDLAMGRAAGFALNSVCCRARAAVRIWKTLPT